MMNFLQKVLNKTIYLISKIKYKAIFGSFGNKSQIISPFLLLNPKSIFIGERVLIRNFARIEAITEWKKGKLTYPPPYNSDKEGTLTNSIQPMHSPCKTQNSSCNQYITSKNRASNDMLNTLEKNTYPQDSEQSCMRYEKPRILFGDHTSVEQSLHLICANTVYIGKACVLSANVYISDCYHEYTDVDSSVMEQPLVVRDVVIGDGCFLGYGACILPGVHLGKHCVVGANAVVTRSFPDYCVLAGIPAMCIKRYDELSREWRRTDCEGSFIQ